MANKKGNPQNLKPVRTKNEAKKRGKNGGIASGEARRKKRTMKQAAKLLLDMGVANPKVAQQLAGFGLAEEDITNQMAIMVAMVNQAAKGNVRAAQFIRDTAGEDPDREYRKEDQKLRREMFEYQQEKDAGVIHELEDMTEVEAEIYDEEDK